MGYSYDPAGTTPPYKNYGYGLCTVKDLPPEDEDLKSVHIAIPLIADFRKSGMEITVEELYDKDGNVIDFTVVSIPTATPSSGVQPLEVTLDGTGSTGPIVEWQWRIVETDVIFSSEPVTTAGIYVATTLTYELTVTSLDGSTSVGTVQVTTTDPAAAEYWGNGLRKP